MNIFLPALLGGALFFFSTGLGTFWPLAWIAPAPLLWLAFGSARNWQVLLASAGAYAIGGLNLFEAYGVMAPMIAVIILVTSSVFAGTVLFARWAQRLLPPILVIFAFPALWTSLEYLNSQISPNGSFGALAYSQVPAPLLIQSVSLFGLSSVTFLLCLVASGLALMMRGGRRAWPAGLVVALLFAANMAFGYARLQVPAGQTERIGAAADDSLAFGADRNATLNVTAAYAEAARTLAAQGAGTIVLPEKIALLGRDWADETVPLARVAGETRSRIIAGFEEHAEQNDNIALTFDPDGRIARYVKRHLVPGLERLTPGTAPGLLAGGHAVVICKDMDFPATINGDAQLGIVMMFVPAWDFHADREIRANMAIMRGVENGFALVRAARDGLLTASDAEGRVLAKMATRKDGMVSIIADLPDGPGGTLYLRIGDAFAWASLVLTLILAGAMIRRLI